MSLQFEPAWSWIIIVGLFAVAVFVIRSAYPSQIRHLATTRQRLLQLCRLAFLLLLFLVSLRPSISVSNEDQSRSVLYLLADSSRSMQTEDGGGGRTRRAAVAEFSTSLKPLLDTLAEKCEIRLRDFADQIASTESITAAADGKLTAFGQILDLASEEMARDRVAAVLLLSDGRQAAFGDLDSDPAAAARRLGRQQRPIYSVGYGGIEAGGSQLDLSLEELDLSREVFQGNALPVRVRLKSTGAGGKPVTLRLLLENRNGVPEGKSGNLEPAAAVDSAKPVLQVTPGSDADEQTVQLQLVPEQTGDLKLAVEAEALPGEARRTNNRVETIIRVRRGGIRVACFDIIRTEQKWLRKINDSSRIQLDFQAIRTGALSSRAQIPDRFFEPGRYDAFIIGDVPASAFRPDQLQALARCCSRGAGLMMIGGRRNFGEGGYGQTVLASLLPVELPAVNPQTSGPRKMLPSRDGLSHFVMQIAAPDQNRQRWEQVPPLTGANNLQLRNNSLAQILAVSEDGLPLLIGQGTGPGRVLAFAGDTTWQWAMQGFEEEHARFWRQVIFWLTRKETDDSQAVWIQASPRDLSPGMPTELTFGARDPQGQPLTDLQFQVEVVNPAGKASSLIPRSLGDSSAAEFSETLLPGDYWARVRALRDGQPFGNIGVTRFHVLQRDPELDDPAADFALLREISHASGGEFLSEDQLRKKLQSWVDQGLPGLSVRRQEQISLWDNWGTLLLLTAILTTEWTLRRRSGLA